MLGGKRVAPAPGVHSLRTDAERNLTALPSSLRGLEQPAEAYRVEISPALRELAAKIDSKILVR
jgi:hypothetical protein